MVRYLLAMATCCTKSTVQLGFEILVIDDSEIAFAAVKIAGLACVHA